MVELYQKQGGSMNNTGNEELNDTSLQCCFSWKEVGSSTFGRSFKDLLKLRSSHTVNHYISIRISQSKISKISRQIKKLSQEVAAAKELQNLARSCAREPSEIISGSAAASTLVISDSSELIANDEVIPGTPQNSPKFSGTICKKKKTLTDPFPHNFTEDIAVGLASLEANTETREENPNTVADNNSTVHTETRIRPDKLSRGIPVERPNRLNRDRKNTRLKESQEDAEYVPFSVLPAKHEEYSPGNSELQFFQEEYTPTYSTQPDKINPVYKPSSSGSNSKFHDKYIPPDFPSESQISPAMVYTPSRRKRYACSANTDEYDPTTPGPAAQRTKKSKSSKAIPTTDMLANLGLQSPKRLTDKLSPASSNQTETPDPKVPTNLFGESDVEIPAVRNTCARDKLSRRAKTCQNLKEEIIDKERTAVKDSGWLSKPSVDREKRTGSYPKIPSTKSMDQLSGSRSTRSRIDTPKTIKIEDVNRKNKVTEQAIAALKNFNKKMQTETLPNIELLDLKKMTEDELKSHFNEHSKEFLFPHFEKYCKRSVRCSLFVLSTVIIRFLRNTDQSVVLIYLYT